MGDAQRASTRDVVPGFGPAVRAARLAAGLSLGDVAAAAGTDPAAVSKLENELRAPSLRMALAIARAVGRPLADIVDQAGRVAAGMAAVADGGSAAADAGAAPARPKGKKK